MPGNLLMNDINDTPPAQTFMARNLTLIVGVSLPVLLVLLFSVAMLIPRMTVEAPQYDLVLSSHDYFTDGRQLNGTLSFSVNDGQLFARFTEDPNYPRAQGNIPAVAIPMPRLYYFSSASGSLRQIEYVLPENLVDGASYRIEELAGQSLLAESTAPDGYRFDNSYRGSRGFLFMFDGYRYNAKIEKEGRAVKIPSIDQNSYVGNYRLVGWVSQEAS